jgi:hypothetical protein
MIKKIFNYLEPLWTGTDGKISLRASAAIALIVDFISNLHHSIYRWDEGRSLEGLSLVLGIEAGLIVALLGLTAYQNMSTYKTDSLATNPQPASDVINIQNAQSVGSTKTTAETVNAQKVDTVNTQNTNIAQQSFD